MLKTGVVCRNLTVHGEQRCDEETNGVMCVQYQVGGSTLQEGFRDLQEGHPSVTKKLHLGLEGSLKRASPSEGFKAAGPP